MRYLVDFSTLKSVSNGLGNYGFQRHFKQNWGTEGLTQLIDIARLIDLFVLSEELLVSERVVDLKLPHEVERITEFIPLEKGQDYYTNLNIYGAGMPKVQSEVENLENLFGHQIVKDFVYEVEQEIKYSDRRFVETLANRLSAFFEVPSIDQKETKSKIFWRLIARTFQYLQTADIRKVPYICHNYRSPIVRTFHPRITSSEFNIYRECGSSMRIWLRETFGSERFEFYLPTLFLAILKDTRRPDELFQIAEQYRNSDEIKAIRRLLQNTVDGNNCVDLARYAELRQISSEESKKFQKKFSNTRADISQSPIVGELSVSITSISAKTSLDVLKASRELYRWLSERNDRRGIAPIFYMGRKAYEILSVEHDLYRLWGVQLTDYHKSLLTEISRLCDS